MQKPLEFLPFISHARRLNARYERVMVSQLTLPTGVYMPEGIPVSEALRYFKYRMVPVLQPTDDLSLKVPDLTNMEFRFLANLPPDTEVVCNVQEVDYQGILQSLIFDERDGAYFDILNGAVYERLLPGLGDALTLAMTGNYTGIRDLVAAQKPPPPAPVQEKVLKRGFSKTIQRLPLDKVERLVTNYIKSRSGSERVPVLFGDTAVAKSALVKDVARKLGRRLVDFRCAFLDKVDIEGFRHRVVSEDGEMFSTAAPPTPILTCTDKYLEYCRVSMSRIRDKLASMKDPEDRAMTLVVLERLEELSTPPILFFDEVTRAKKAVQNAFVQILNQKTFRGMAMTEARIIAATNYPLMMGEEYLDVYLTEELDDAGIKERFEPIRVYPNDVSPRWFNYIQNDGAFDPVVLEFLEQDRTRAYQAYRATEAIAQGTDPVATDPEDIGAVPFPNFRTWEFVSDHVLAVREGKTKFNPDLVYGFIGKHDMSEAFVEHVKAKLPEAQEPPTGPDMLTNAVNNSFETGTPLLIMGTTSIGKTTRVKMLERRHARVVTINMAQKDRVDVMGAPSSVPAHDSISHGLARDLPASVRGVLEQGVGEILPETPRSTRMLPDSYLRNEIDRARAASQKVVLFFDELNRADPNTMSAVLEAVSDQRFGGVDFPYRCNDVDHQWSGRRDELVRRKCPEGHPVESMVIVMAACNYGPGYDGAEKLDPAISGRFSVIKKVTFDEDDRTSVLDYMKTNGYPQVIVDFLSQKSLDELRKMLMSVEKRELTKAAPSLRSFTDAKLLLEQVEDEALHGKLLDKEEEKDLGMDIQTLREVYDRLKMIPRNWAGFGSEQVTYAGETLPVKDLVKDIRDTVNDFYSRLSAGQTDPGEEGELALDLSMAFNELRRVNLEVRAYREQEFESKFGPRYSPEFLNFYNSVAGSTILSIEDLVSEDLIQQYAEQAVATSLSPLEKENALRMFIKDYVAAWPGASKVLYQAVVRSITSQLEPDRFIEIPMSYTQGDPDVVALFDRSLDAGFSKELMRILNLTHVTPDEIDAYYQGN